MTDIYYKISKLSDKFREMTYGLTKDKNEIDEVVQELMLYFLSMNPTTLKEIWEKDGEQGIIKYGAVVINRSLNSKYSRYYYKYKKYYTHIDSSIYTLSCTYSDDNKYFDNNINKSLQNVANEEVDNRWKKLEQIDNTLEKDFSWYDSKIFQLYYYEGNTLDSLAEKTKISRNSLFSTIDKVRNILKTKLNEES
jgi:DNA-directed RNA polymerase specialized sigma24 family protein